MDQRMDEQLDFLEACSAGDVDRAKLLLRDGLVDVNFHHRVNGWTALHWAARRGHEEVVRLLLREGFDARAVTRDGKTPADVAQEERLRRLLSADNEQLPHGSDTMITLHDTGSDKAKSNDTAKRIGNGGVRSMSDTLNDSSLRAVKKTFSMDSNGSSFSTPPDSPTTPTKSELYSYGNHGFVNRTRFLLVRTSSGFGKEAFKRVTLPGGGTVECLKMTIERAMKMGRVVQVVTLPERIPIETDQQIRSLSDSQKVEVVFEPFTANESQQGDGGNRKFSLNERTSSDGKPSSAKRGHHLQRKATSMADDYAREALINGGIAENLANGNASHEHHNGDVVAEAAETIKLSTPLDGNSPSPQMADVIELEESASSNCSFNASSSYAKARVVLPHHQVVNDNAILSVPAALPKAVVGPSEQMDGGGDEAYIPNGGGDEAGIPQDEIKLEEALGPGVPMEVEVSCECSLSKNSPSSEVLSSVPYVDDAKAAEQVGGNKRTVKKVSQILGAESEAQLESMLKNEDVLLLPPAGDAQPQSETPRERDQQQERFYRSLKLAAIAAAAVLCVGGVGYYFYSRSK